VCYVNWLLQPAHRPKVSQVTLSSGTGRCPRVFLGLEPILKLCFDERTVLEVNVTLKNAMLLIPIQSYIHLSAMYIAHIY
jgi:hypothetical protein